MKYLVQVPAYGWQRENMATRSGEIRLSRAAQVVEQDLGQGQVLVVPLAQYPNGVGIDRSDRQGPVIMQDGEVVADVNPNDIKLVK